MYKPDLVLNYLQWLICDKTEPNQTNPVDHYKHYQLKLVFGEQLCSKGLNFSPTK